MVVSDGEEGGLGVGSGGASGWAVGGLVREVLGFDGDSDRMFECVLEIVGRDVFLRGPPGEEMGRMPSWLRHAPPRAA